MARVIHIVPGLFFEANGIAVAAKLVALDQHAKLIDAKATKAYELKAEEVWVHSLWMPCVWLACWKTKISGKRLVRMLHGNLDPLRVKYHRFRKWLVGPIERYFLRKADRIIATCDAEKEWIEAYLGKKCPEIVVTDIKRFFKLGVREGSFGFRVSGSELERGECNSQLTTHNSQLNLLYLGRRHPLKGVEFLESAVAELNSSTHPLPTPPLLKIVSNAFGEELEKVWEWCDVLVLPTLSENFGLVIAEALERGKRVITTDGASAWEEDCSLELELGEIWSGYGGRLLYLKGYRYGTKSKRIELLKKAIRFFAKG